MNTICEYLRLFHVIHDSLLWCTETLLSVQIGSYFEFGKFAFALNYIFELILESISRRNSQFVMNYRFKECDGKNQNMKTAWVWAIKRQNWIQNLLKHVANWFHNPFKLVNLWYVSLHLFCPKIVFQLTIWKNKIFKRKTKIWTSARNTLCKLVHLHFSLSFWTLNYLLCKCIFWFVETKKKKFRASLVRGVFVKMPWKMSVQMMCRKWCRDSTLVRFCLFA